MVLSGDLVPNGNDIELTDVAAFDVKVFSSDCYVGLEGGILIEPGDPFFSPTDGDGDGIPFTCDINDGNPALGLAPGAGQFGAFVDLGHRGGGQFSQGVSPTGHFVPTRARNEATRHR